MSKKLVPLILIFMFLVSGCSKSISNNSSQINNSDLGVEELDSPEIVRINGTEGAPLRDAPGIIQDIITTIPSDQSVQVIEKIIDWYYVDYNGTFGWVGTEYIAGFVEDETSYPVNPEFEVVWDDYEWQDPGLDSTVPDYYVQEDESVQEAKPSHLPWAKTYLDLLESLDVQEMKMLEIKHGGSTREVSPLTIATWGKDNVVYGISFGYIEEYKDYLNYPLLYMMTGTIDVYDGERYADYNALKYQVYEPYEGGLRYFQAPIQMFGQDIPIGLAWDWDGYFVEFATVSLSSNDLRDSDLFRDNIDSMIDWVKEVERLTVEEMRKE